MLSICKLVSLLQSGKSKTLKDSVGTMNLLFRSSRHQLASRPHDLRGCVHSNFNTQADHNTDFDAHSHTNLHLDAQTHADAYLDAGLRPSSWLGFGTGASGGSFTGSGDSDGSVGNGEDGPAGSVDAPEEELPQPRDIAVETDPELDNPVIKFGVKISGYQTWKAKILVYSAMGDGLQTSALASLETSSTEVSWNELFPGVKPDDGVYFYDITVEGTMDANRTPATEHVEGLAGEGTTDHRLNRDLVVKDLSWTALSDAPDAVSAEDVVEIKFRLLTSGGQMVSNATPSAVLVNPLFGRAGQISLQRQDDGFYHGTTTLPMDDAKDFGDWIIFVQANAQSNAGPKVGVPGARRANNRPQITGMAFGYGVDQFSGSGQNTVPVTDHLQMRRPLANQHVTFRAFFRVTRRGVSKWYSENAMSSSEVQNLEWIGGDIPSGYPAASLKLADAWKQPASLGLRVRWRKFDNNIVDQQDEGGGKYRWYGLKPQDEDGTSVSDDGGLGLTWYWNVDFGVNWWGVRVGYNKYTATPAGGGKLVPYLFQLPTDRRSKKFLFPTTDTAKNTVSTGYGGRVQQKIWLPDPSTVNTKTPGPSGRVTEWSGFIDGVGLPRQIRFADGDTLGTPTQAAFNSKLLEQALSFLNTPYGWGGQDYGGRQSTKPR